MIIGIDGRSLMGSEPTGVASYGLGLLRVLMDKATDYTYIVLTTGLRSGKEVLKYLPKSCQHVHVRVPNKLLHATMLATGKPTVDALFGRAIDVLISPNLHFGRVSDACVHIQTVHDLSFDLYPETYSLDRRLWHSLLDVERLCRRADQLIVPSHHTKHDVVKRFCIDSEQIHVLSPVVHPISSTKARKVDTPFLFFLGTIEPRKNIDVLLDAYAILPATLKEQYPLIIAGAHGWRCQKIRKRIDQSRHVRYIGYITPEKKACLLEQATALIYPSLFEGFGLPVLEAFAAGTPVITSDRSSLPEVAGGAALLVDPRNSADLARTIERLLNDRSLQDILIAKGRERIARYASTRSGDRLYSLIKSHEIS